MASTKVFLNLCVSFGVFLFCRFSLWLSYLSIENVTLFLSVIYINCFAFEPRCGGNTIKKLQKGNDMALTIASFNVMGLRDIAKRREVFNCLRSKHFAIYMSQKVHCTKDTNCIIMVH